jgi:hypothetical protein
VSDPSFSNRYHEALLAFVEERSERRLKTAYDLGRAAVQGRLAILDVAAVHTQALTRIAGDSTGLVDTLSAAGDFLVESLAAFEMVQRGVTEARRVAFEERRRARMLRELSSVLADASVASAARDSVGELAQLVAEIAREATGAASARILLRPPGGAREVEATAEEPDVDTWSEFLQPIAELGSASEHQARSEVVHETLVALDGRQVGSLEVVTADGRRFRSDDRATVIQIAQMTAAWLERAQWL